MNDQEYKKFQQEMEESCRKEEARIRAIRKKKEERKQIKKFGGGKAIAKAIMGKDTDFEFGNNQQQKEAEEYFDSNACMGPVECKRCKKHHGYCREIEEKNKMLPTGEGTGRSANKKSGLNWIKIDDLTTTPKEAKILMVKYNENGNFGPSVMMKLAFEGEIRYLSVRPTKKDPRYKLLLDAFGPDENNWVDSRIHLLAEKDEFSEAYMMRIAIPNSQQEKPSANSTTATRGSRR